MDGSLRLKEKYLALTKAKMNNFGGRSRNLLEPLVGEK